MKRIASPTGHPERVQARFVITCWEDGALSVEGPIDDKVYALAVLDNAKDAIRNHKDPRMVDVVVPSRDVEVPAHASPLASPLAPMIVKG